MLWSRSFVRFGARTPAVAEIFAGLSQDELVFATLFLVGVPFETDFQKILSCQNLVPMSFNCDSADQSTVHPTGCHWPCGQGCRLPDTRPKTSKFDKREE